MKTYPASLVALAFASSVSAQTIVAPVMSDRALAPQSLFAASGTTAVVPPSDIASVLGSGLPLWQWGPFALRPHAAYRYAHSSGLLLLPGEPLSADTQTFTIGSALELGLHWRADYSGSWVRYSDARFTNSFDQSAALSGSYGYFDWVFGLSGSYSVGHPMLLEAGGQTRQETFSTGASAHRSVGQHSFVDLSVTQSRRTAAAIGDSHTRQSSALRDWSSHAALGHTWSEKLTSSAGVTVGYATQAVGPDMTYVSPEFQTQWTPTERIAVGATAGWENRRFHGKSTPTFNSPVYSGTVSYHPVETTSVSLGATQGVAASYLGDAITRSTGWNAGLQQRLFHVLYGSVSYSKQRSRYFQTASALPNVRTDRYDTISGSLSVPFLGRGAASAFWQRTHNRSSLGGYGFTSTSYGAEIRFSF